MKQTLKAGLVGAGYVSEFHLKALRRLPHVEIVGIHDRDRDRAEAVAKREQLRMFGSLDELVSAGANVIHVLTPPATHAPITIQALERGCDVLVEKPAATSVEDCDRMSEAARRSGRTVCVNHSLLRDPFIERALALVRAGAVGEVLTVDYFRSSDYPPYRGGPLPPQYRDGGYPFRDLGVHALYVMQEFLGAIEHVSATAATRGGDPNLRYDEWRALVRAQRGSGQIQLSWNVRPMQHVIVVQGTRGVVRADLFSMCVTAKRSTPLPKSIERAWNALNESRQIGMQVTANMVRFAAKKLLPYHGLQMLVAECYANLAAGKPTPVGIEQARPIVDWTEKVAREADESKRRFLAAFPAQLSAKVLVTGATGFIGRHLVNRLLADNQQLRLFVRREPSGSLRSDPRVEVVLGDLGDPEAVDRAVSGISLIYHVGAAMSGSAHDFERGTVAGTRNVVESALKHKVARMVYVSSLSVLHAAAARRGGKIREDWPLEPHPSKRGAYSQTKLDAEKIVTEAARHRGLNAVILRPGQVFGPGAPVLTPAVARRAGKRLIMLGNGKVVLPLVYVEDVVDAILCAAQRDVAPGSIFHVVDDAEIDQNEFVRRFLASSNETLTVLRVPRVVVYALACGVQVLSALLGRNAPLSIYRVKSALAPISFNCSAVRDQLGWSPVVGVEAGLARTLA